MLYFVKFHGVKYPMESEFTLKSGEYILCEIKNERFAGKASDEIHCKLQPEGKVLHLIYDSEKDKLKEIQKDEEKALDFCKKRIKHYKLTMKVVGVDKEWNGKRLKFYFLADKRIDFRTLVKDLKKEFNCIIELRHMGVRDYAGFMGGLGLCGSPLCCNTFLAEKPRVKLETARNQDIYISPSKISGLCGRLLCCLQYEQNFYDKTGQEFPERDNLIKTEKGNSQVLHRNMLTGIVTVSNPDETQEEIPIEEIKKKGDTWIRLKKKEK
ncbi:stage 0 sporulation protein [candidate division WOR-3 bacterium]|nr:stage 0 sporulation protein [candidate division WOR-3 bacterium]